jgi:RNA polymerase sigma-70 factor (ECF subfamily)
MAVRREKAERLADEELMPLVGRKDPEAFEVLYDRHDAARGSVRSWLLSVVRNRAIDFLRSKAGKAPKLDFDDDSALEQRPAAERTEEEALRRETASEIRGALGKLPGEQSKVIELAYFGGFSHSEIAAILSLPIGTVKGRMRLGLEKIRGELAEGLA